MGGIHRKIQSFNRTEFSPVTAGIKEWWLKTWP